MEKFFESSSSMFHKKRQMKLHAVFIIVSLLLHGCAVYTQPKDNQDFVHVTKIGQFTGLYKNKGEPSGYLSKIIWRDVELPSHRKIRHDAIELIEVREGQHSLIVKAIHSGCSIHEQTYVHGKDFDINDGKIVINTHASLLTRGAGDVLVGPSREKITLGIDAAGQGKYRSSTYAAGLAFLILPVVVTSTQEVRFERVSYTTTGFKACPE